MASRFSEPVSNTAELKLRATAIPTNTKATTDWGIPVFGATGPIVELIQSLTSKSVPSLSLHLFWNYLLKHWLTS